MDKDPDCSLCGGESCRGHNGPIFVAKRNGKRHRVCFDCCTQIEIAAVAEVTKLLESKAKRVEMFVQNEVKNGD